MMDLKKISCGVLCAWVLMMAGRVAGAQQTKVCSATDADKPAVAETLRTMYGAAMKNDLAGFDALIAPGFYMYDNGHRYEGDEIMTKVMPGYTQKGFKFVWSVQEPVVEVDCNTAWITYVNKGSITRPDGTKADTSWLESAVLEKRNGRWLLRFFHSTRVAQ
ncbi:YybH family protein [Terracidiphilus gabretensis]|uniref:YybH family protein n=1 Tax=Terracidiphilus gabretensis TaxID=1577687 RepID=UPI00071B3A66|nr:nuclear transport factor 2 family protein [Terracidiphilus gabretensis]